jgi:hypothetical protein
MRSAVLLAVFSLAFPGACPCWWADAVADSSITDDSTRTMQPARCRVCSEAMPSAPRPTLDRVRPRRVRVRVRRSEAKPLLPGRGPPTCR